MCHESVATNRKAPFGYEAYKRKGKARLIPHYIESRHTCNKKAHLNQSQFRNVLTCQWLEAALEAPAISIVHLLAEDRNLAPNIFELLMEEGEFVRMSLVVYIRQKRRAEEFLETDIAEVGGVQLEGIAEQFPLD